MGQLAIHGGKPVRPASAQWPQWPVCDDDDIDRLVHIARSGAWASTGSLKWTFAQAFTRYQGAKYGLCCANGTSALQLALEALDIGAYDEVIVPGMTWPATASACLDINAVPILVDVEPDTWCLDVDAAEAAITDRTKAIIVVHLYGCMPDLGRLARLCRKYGVYLIEDCAHQHGSFWEGRGVGTFGDVGCFSFQESKVLTCGEGGFTMCKTRRLFERLYSLHTCGRGYNEDLTHAVQSGNYRITEWQAGILLGGLKKLDRQVRLRERNAKYLDAQLGQICGILPMHRRPQTTQQSYFCYGFRLDAEVFGDVSNERFCSALNAELNLAEGFGAPYEPLNNCWLYKPHTKRRYHLTPRHRKAIEPSRFSLPVCTEAYERSGVIIHHSALMGGRRDLNDIIAAVAKVVENLAELRPS